MVEDSAEDTLLIAAELQRGGLDPVFERVETEAGLEAALRSQAWDLVVCDYAMPQLNGPNALAIYRASGLDIPFIIVSGKVGEEAVADMLKTGAHDFVVKDHLSRLAPAVKRELATAEERRERRQAENITSFLASIVESCEDAIIGKTLNGTIVSWNSGAEHLYGYTSQEVVGRSVGILIPEHRPEELPDICERIKRGESVDDMETVRVRKDGTKVEVSVTISPIRDANGAVIGSSSIARDITQRKKEENERLGLIRDLTTALGHGKT
jgi:PAS domain S-box-containing protein